MKVGIDLGTTRSAVGIVEAGSPSLLVNAAGDRLTPSTVYFSQDGDATCIGKQAVTEERNTPNQVIRNAKLKMGEDHTYPIGDIEPTPVDVSAEILKKLRSIAEDYTEEDEEITGAVITVPAYFTVDQKSDTREAAKQAGFENIDLLHEPTAAAVSHGFDTDQSETVFVYDFGGGTLDISVMEVDGNDYQTLAVAGDSNLGGYDFTQRLSELIAEEIRDDEGVDPLNDYRARHAIMQVAEDTKKRLSGNEDTNIHAPMLAMVDGTTVGIKERSIDRTEFEDEVADLIDDAMAPIDKALEKARLDSDDIDTVLLVGGSSQIPAIYNRIQDKFGFKPTKTAELDRVVAKGAAIVADDDDSRTDQFACPASECDETFDHVVGDGELTDHIEKHHDDEGDDTGETFECPKDECDASPFDTKGDRDRHVADEHELDPGTKIALGDLVGQSFGTGLEDNQLDILIPDDTELPDEGEVVEATERYTTPEDDMTKLPVFTYQGDDVDNLSNNEKLREGYVPIPELPKGEVVVEVTFTIDDDGVLSSEAELIEPEESELEDDKFSEVSIERKNKQQVNND